jgi:hypothetical protein
MQIDTVSLSALSSFEDNPRRISSDALARLKESIRSLGLFKPLLSWRDAGDRLIVIGGNQRLRAIREMVAAGEIEESPIPVVVFDGDEVSARTIALRDNASEGEWEWASLASYVTDLEALARDAAVDLDLTLTGFDAKTLDGLHALAEKQREAISTLFGGDEQDGTAPGGERDTSTGTQDGGEEIEPGEGESSGEREEDAPGLAARFLFVPFSVLDQNRGEWRSRKVMWNTLFNSTRGRGGDGPVVTEAGVGVLQNRGLLTLPPSGRDPMFYRQKNEAEARLGRKLDTREFERFYYKPPENASGLAQTGTSTFDPVLAEVIYRWWGLPGGSVLDPFAGGSVRGIVSSALRLRYTGVDLRKEQVEENREQWESLASALPPGFPAPRWIEGDSTGIDGLLDADERFDLVFSCPPYFDLEVYSTDERDLSTLSWASFLDGYRKAIRASVARLRDNRFAVFVVGDVRDPRGSYRNFVGETVRAFCDAGMDFYNEAILVSGGAGTAIRVGRPMSRFRKLGKIHQNVLVFYKGDVKRIPDEFGVLDLQGRTGLLDETVATPGSPPAPSSTTSSSSRKPRKAKKAPLADAALPSEEPLAAEPVGPAPESGASVEAGSGPAWARGFDLDRLREIARLFKRHDEGLVLGAFGAVKENVIAGWLAEGRLDLVERDGRVVAACCSSLVARRKVGRDWQDDPRFEFEEGARHVTRFAFEDEDAARLLAEQVERLAVSRGLWVEAWMEHPGDRAFASGLRTAWQGSKVSAASEIRGVFRRLVSGGPATLRGYSTVETAHLSRLDLPPVDTAPLLRAVEERVSGWADHYSGYNKRNSWTALALRSFGGDPSFIIKPSEMSKAWKEEHADALSWSVEDTSLRALLPEAEALLRLVPGRHERVRLMRLAPGGGELTRHSDITDPDAGIRPGTLARIHIPLVSNPEVVFDGWLPDGTKVRRHFAVGSVWYLDTRKPHRAVNAGTTDRIHLVIDAVVDGALLRLIEAGVESEEAGS